MLERELALFGLMRSYCQRLTADLDDSRLAEQPVPGMVLNHAAWSLGHLAATYDNGLRLMGQPTVCPDEWRKLFGRGSKPISDRSAYPSKTELLEALETGCDRLATAIAQADPVRLEAPYELPNENLRAHLKTVGDLLAHIMTTHQALHLGQLAMWRRLMGFEPLF